LTSKSHDDAAAAQSDIDFYRSLHSKKKYVTFSNYSYKFVGFNNSDLFSKVTHKKMLWVKFTNI